MRNPTGNGWLTTSSTEDHPDNYPSAALSGLPGDLRFVFFFVKVDIRFKLNERLLCGQTCRSVLKQN
ncbi:hypothetical protein NBRC116589_44590 [Ruegeria sp. HU-ET01832]